MCMLSNDIYDYYIVSQGKTTIPNVDDGEECTLTDVSSAFDERKVAAVVFQPPSANPTDQHVDGQILANEPASDILPENRLLLDRVIDNY